MSYVRRERHMLALVYESSQKPDFRNQTDAKVEIQSTYLLAAWLPPCYFTSLTLSFFIGKMRLLI